MEELTNQLGSIISLNVLFAGALFYAKDLIFSLVNKVYNALFYTVTISDDSKLMSALVRNIEENNFLKFRRNYQIGNMGIRIDNDERRNEHLTFGYGYHFGFYSYRPIFMNAHLHESKGGAGWQARPYTEISLSTFFFFKGAVNKIVEDTKRDSVAERDWTHVIKDGYTNSFYTKKLKNSGIDSVILPKNIEKDLRSDLEMFRSSEDRYEDLNIPYKRIFLLHGAPGTGKSSFARAVSREYSLDFMVVDLCSSHNEGELIGDVKRGPKIVLFEDIDSVYNGRKPVVKTQKPVSFELLLNVLDGNYATFYETIVFITANDISKVDPVLSRPGRIDRIIEFKVPTLDQKMRLCKRFGVKYSKDYDKIKSMSELQEQLIRKVL